MKIDKSLILDEIKKYLNIKSDKDFCIYLGIKPNVLSNWKKRNTFDIDKITQKCEFISVDYLLTGKGPMLIKPVDEISTAKESITEYNINNQSQTIMDLLTENKLLKERIADLLQDKENLWVTIRKYESLMMPNCEDKNKQAI